MRRGGRFTAICNTIWPLPSPYLPPAPTLLKLSSSVVQRAPDMSSYFDALTWQPPLFAKFHNDTSLYGRNDMRQTAAPPIRRPPFTAAPWTAGARGQTPMAGRS